MRPALRGMRLECFRDIISKYKKMRELVRVEGGAWRHCLRSTLWGGLMLMCVIADNNFIVAVIQDGVGNFQNSRYKILLLMLQVRAGGKKGASRDPGTYKIGDRSTHIVSTDDYAMGECLRDLLDLAAKLLVVGELSVSFDSPKNLENRCSRVAFSAFEAMKIAQQGPARPAGPGHEAAGSRRVWGFFLVIHKVQYALGLFFNSRGDCGMGACSPTHPPTHKILTTAR